jgi:hypothetical protein
VLKSEPVPLELSLVELSLVELSLIEMSFIEMSVIEMSLVALSLVELSLLAMSLVELSLVEPSLVGPSLLLPPSWDELESSTQAAIASAAKAESNRVRIGLPRNRLRGTFSKLCASRAAGHAPHDRPAALALYRQVALALYRQVVETEVASALRDIMARGGLMPGDVIRFGYLCDLVGG